MASDYQTALEPVRGKVSMVLTFGGPDRDRMWRRRKRLHDQDAEVRFCAGRLVLHGQFGIKTGKQVRDPVLVLDGNATDYPVFRAEDPPSSSRWNFARHYELRAEAGHQLQGPSGSPFSIVPESDRARS